MEHKLDLVNTHTLLNVPPEQFEHVPPATPLYVPGEHLSQPVCWLLLLWPAGQFWHAVPPVEYFPDPQVWQPVWPMLLPFPASQGVQVVAELDVTIFASKFGIPALASRRLGRTKL